jgi:four helix bundle protein
MAGARHFKELVCWQLADELKVRLYAVVERPHVRRDFEWVDQVVRAASSAPSNISEGFGRWSNAEFLHYFDISRASLNEIQNHLKDGVDRRHLDLTEFRELHTLSRRTLQALAKFQSYLRRYGPRRDARQRDGRRRDGPKKDGPKKEGRGKEEPRKDS